MLTAKQLEEIRARAGLVSNRIGKLASGEERFKMCIPPQPYDDDIAIATLARTDVPALLADNDALRAEVERLRQERDMLQVGYKAAEASRRLAIVELNALRAVVEKADALAEAAKYRHTIHPLTSYEAELDKAVAAYREARHAG